MPGTPSVCVCVCLQGPTSPWGVELATSTSIAVCGACNEDPHLQKALRAMGTGGNVENLTSVACVSLALAQASAGTGTVVTNPGTAAVGPHSADGPNTAVAPVAPACAVDIGNGPRVVGEEDDAVKQPESHASSASFLASSSHVDAVPRRSTNPSLSLATAAVHASWQRLAPCWEV